MVWQGLWRPLSSIPHSHSTRRQRNSSSKRITKMKRMSLAVMIAMAALAILAAAPAANAGQADQLTQDQVDGFREAFMLYDKDGNGEISPAELWHEHTMQGLTLTDVELRDMIRSVDADGESPIPGLPSQDWVGTNSLIINTDGRFYKELEHYCS